MARFIVENRITDVDALKDFDAGGYAYKPDASDAEKMTFVRDYPSN
jgi:cytoplasmic iron level regulating protein YaaA (DUF328/UPF0246 family)